MVDALSAFTAWDEILGLVFGFVNDDVVASHVEQLLAINHMQVVPQVAVNAEHEFRRDINAL